MIETQQILVSPDAAEILDLLRCDGSAQPELEQLGEAADGVERRAQLVAHHREELRLRGVRALELRIPLGEHGVRVAGGCGHRVERRREARHLASAAAAPRRGACSRPCARSDGCAGHLAQRPRDEPAEEPCADGREGEHERARRQAAGAGSRAAGAGSRTPTGRARPARASSGSTDCTTYTPRRPARRSAPRDPRRSGSAKGAAHGPAAERHPLVRAAAGEQHARIVVDEARGSTASPP